MLALAVQSLEDFDQSRSAAVLYACPMSAVELKCRAGIMAPDCIDPEYCTDEQDRLFFIRWIQLCLLPPSHKRGSGGLGDAAQILASLDADVARLAWCHGKQRSGGQESKEIQERTPALGPAVAHTPVVDAVL